MINGSIESPCRSVPWSPCDACVRDTSCGGESLGGRRALITVSSVSQWNPVEASSLDSRHSQQDRNPTHTRAIACSELDHCFLQHSRRCEWSQAGWRLHSRVQLPWQRQEYRCVGSRESLSLIWTTVAGVSSSPSMLMVPRSLCETSKPRHAIVLNGEVCVCV